MIDQKTMLNEGNEEISAEALTGMINDRDIKVEGFFDHKKASERYVIISLRDDAKTREWYLPYYYRRTNVRIDEAKGLVSFVKHSKTLLSSNNIAKFIAEMRPMAREIIGHGSSVTYPIFMQLLKNCGHWVWNKNFDNPNPQRRIQDIKEMGFTLATKIENKRTFHMLLPFAVVKAPTYETIPPKIRKAIVAALGGVDAYTGGMSSLSMLPDHKFPEIRWEEGTAESNEGLTPEMMREKFQLVSEAVNQTKREVCRKCFQTGVRGKLNGIDYFYHGGEKWPKGVPTTGIAARVGCVGCFWYDMMEWRSSLNKLIKEKNDSR